MKKKAVDFRFGLDEPPDWVKKEMEPVPILPDEQSDWAKEAARKIMATPPSIRRKINKIFKSTPPQDRAFICKMAEKIEI